MAVTIPSYSLEAQSDFLVVLGFFCVCVFTLIFLNNKVKVLCLYFLLLCTLYGLSTSTHWGQASLATSFPLGSHKLFSYSLPLQLYCFLFMSIRYIIWYLHYYDYVNIIHNHNNPTLNSYQRVRLDILFFLGDVPPESFILSPQLGSEFTLLCL